MKIVSVVGARPNFMKIAPLMHVFEREPETFDVTLVHTGQHYDERMSKIFFRDLGIRKPDIDLGIGSGSHARQTAAIMVEIEDLLLEHQPDLVVVVGDVNSTVAAALAAAKLNIKVAHVEAGLRSFDRTMPEEINRLVTDSISDVLFTPSRDGDENLLKEGVPREQIFFVGNVMIDTLFRCRDLSTNSSVFEDIGIERGHYALLTLHRPANVDDPVAFGRILEALERIEQHLPIVFPLHPRTEAKISQFGFQTRLSGMSNLVIVPPQSYLDFLALEANATIVLSDSGGIQEETTALRVPCLTLRENTERPVTVTEGSNRIVGNDPDLIVRETQRVLDGEFLPGEVPEFWDGQAAERIAAVLKQVISANATSVRRAF